MTSTEEFNACKQYLRKETKLGMEQMLPGHRQRVTTELILRYSNHFPKGCQMQFIYRFGSYSKRVLMGLTWLANNDIDFKCKRKSAGKQLAKEDLAAFVQV